MQLGTRRREIRLDSQPVEPCDLVQFLNQPKQSNDGAGVGRKQKRERKKKEGKENRVQRVRASMYIRPSTFRNSRRGNKSSEKMCELVDCRQLWCCALPGAVHRNIESNCLDRVTWTRGADINRRGGSVRSLGKISGELAHTREHDSPRESEFGDAESRASFLTFILLWLCRKL